MRIEVRSVDVGPSPPVVVDSPAGRFGATWRGPAPAVGDVIDVEIDCAPCQWAEVVIGTAAGELPPGIAAWRHRTGRERRRGCSALGARYHAARDGRSPTRRHARSTSRHSSVGHPALPQQPLATRPSGAAARTRARSSGVGSPSAESRKPAASSRWRARTYAPAPAGPTRTSARVREWTTILSGPCSRTIAVTSAWCTSHGLEAAITMFASPTITRPNFHGRRRNSRPRGTPRVSSAR